MKVEATFFMFIHKKKLLSLFLLGFVFLALLVLSLRILEIDVTKWFISKRLDSEKVSVIMGGDEEMVIQDTVVKMRFISNLFMEKYEIEDIERDGETISRLTLSFLFKTPSNQTKKLVIQTTHEFYLSTQGLLLPEEVSDLLKVGSYYSIRFGFPTENFSYEQKIARCESNTQLLNKISLSSCVTRIADYDLEGLYKTENFWNNNQSRLIFGEVMLNSIIDQTPVL